MAGVIIIRDYHVCLRVVSLQTVKQTKPSPIVASQETRQAFEIPLTEPPSSSPYTLPAIFSGEPASSDVYTTDMRKSDECMRFLADI